MRVYTYICLVHQAKHSLSLYLKNGHQISFSGLVIYIYIYMWGQTTKNTLKKKYKYKELGLKSRTLRIKKKMLLIKNS